MLLLEMNFRILCQLFLTEILQNKNFKCKFEQIHVNKYILSPIFRRVWDSRKKSYHVPKTFISLLHFFQFIYAQHLR